MLLSAISFDPSRWFWVSGVGKSPRVALSRSPIITNPAFALFVSASSEWAADLSVVTGAGSS